MDTETSSKLVFTEAAEDSSKWRSPRNTAAGKDYFPPSCRLTESSSTPLDYYYVPLKKRKRDNGDTSWRLSEVLRSPTGEH